MHYRNRQSFLHGLLCHDPQIIAFMLGESSLSAGIVLVSDASGVHCFAMVSSPRFRTWVCSMYRMLLDLHPLQLAAPPSTGVSSAQHSGKPPGLVTVIVRCRSGGLNPIRQLVRVDRLQTNNLADCVYVLLLFVWYSTMRQEEMTASREVNIR